MLIGELNGKFGEVIDMNPNYENLPLHAQNKMLELSKNNFLIRIGYTMEEAEKVSMKEADEIAVRIYRGEKLWDIKEKLYPK